MLRPRPFRARLFALLLVGAGALATPSSADADTVHVVGRGQTLFWIAKRYRTTPEAIRVANGLREGQLIHPGLSLTIPGVADKSDKSKSKEKEKEPKDPAAKGKKDSTKGAGAKAKEKEKDDAHTAKGAKDAKSAKGKKADPSPASYVARPKKPGFVTIIRGTEKLEAQVLTRGKLNQAALPGLTKILRHVASDSKKGVDPRLATLIGVVSDHFGGKTVHVVSGYRPFSKRQYTPHSNHNLGKAMDFTIEGVPNTVVRDYCRTLRDAGVGYYPNSTFVHLDVRTGKAYWIDYSGPGEPPRYDARNKGKVDESTRDVYAGEEKGSPETQGATKQATDSKNGSAESAPAKPATAQDQGPKAPAPEKSDSPTPPKGVSGDPHP